MQQEPKPRREPSGPVSRADRCAAGGARLDRCEAVLFDMDGVITDTAGAHASAWKQTFDEYLRRRAEHNHEPFIAFDPEREYRRHVDGRPRYQGAANVLRARGIDLPYGSPDDDPGRETVCGLANRKNRNFRRWLARHRVTVYDDALALIARLRRRGLATGIFSASRNCGAVLASAGIAPLFDARVDGGVLAAQGLPGKPDPAMLLECARRLGVAPAAAAVVEDSIAGVEAGRRGGLALVVGVNRTVRAPRSHDGDAAGRADGQTAALLAAGAHRVVADLRVLLDDGDSGDGRRAGAGSDEGSRLVYRGYRPDSQRLREALCVLGNGYFATRGAAPDAVADAVHYPGTYLAGGYDRQVTRIAGRDVENEDLVNLPNWLSLSFRTDDGDWFHIDRVEVLDYRQTLDVERGLLLRALRVRDADGRITRWRERRLVSMADRHLAALAVELTAENWSGTLGVRSALDGGVCNAGVRRYDELTGRHLETLALDVCAEDTIRLRCRTLQSRLEIVEAARTRLYRRDATGARAEPGPLTRETLRRDDWIGQVLSCPVAAGQTVGVEKLVALYTSRDTAIAEPGLAAAHTLALAGDVDALADAHRLAWRQLWESCAIDADVDLDDAVLKLKVHVFHLLQTVSHHSIDRDIGVPARGWHGEAYRGHIFWDELFVFPFLNLRLPALSRSLLYYRYRRLGAARRAAAEAGCRGAMFPWQSGSSGREETQQVHLNPQSGRWLPDDSRRQRHINAAIAYNVWQYFQVTGDEEFLHDYGAELLFEIARFWASLARYDDARDRFDILGVMGPDEYHTGYPDGEPGGGLNNNAYTNVMAAWALTRALDARELLSADARRLLDERLQLGAEELDAWDEISRKLRVVFHRGPRGERIISQFAGYAELAEFDWQGYRDSYGDIQRLDRLLEAEGDSPNRYKASKQADVLMLFYLFSADELALLFERLGYRYESRLIPDNIDYYLARTSHGSTLSFIAHSWVLARAHRPDAWPLFERALASDLEDVQGGTTAEGIHLGAMAGTVDLAQRCFTGIDPRAGTLHFNPVLPPPLRCLTMTLYYRRHRLRVRVTHERLQIDSARGQAPPISVAYRGHLRRLTPGDSCRFRLIGLAPRDDGDGYGEGEGGSGTPAAPGQCTTRRSR